MLFATNRCFWLCFVDWSIKSSIDETSSSDCSIFCFIICSKSVFETVIESMKITFSNRWFKFKNVEMNTLIVIFRFVVCFFIFFHCFWMINENCLCVFLCVKFVFWFKFHKIQKQMRSSCNQRVFRLLRMINWFKRFTCNRFYISLIKNLLKRIFIFQYWNFQNRHAWRYINYDHRRCIFNTFLCERRCIFLNRFWSVDSTK